MFEPRTDRIRELSEIYPERIKELETIFSGRTNVYIDFANVIGWQDKLGWHVEIRRLKQLLDSFSSVEKEQNEGRVHNSRGNNFNLNENPSLIALFFLIGDPKQAIYSFRGADIFAYMKAAAGIDLPAAQDTCLRTGTHRQAQAGGRHTITENWRSEPGLVKAVNTLFPERGNPFVFEDISFVPVKAAHDKVYEFFTFNGRREAPLQWWFVPAEKHDGSGKPLSREKARNIIISALAAEISRLLKCARQGRALIGQRPLEEADVAVLVRTNREARLVQEGLRRLRIPSVLHNAGNVFDTPEAEEMERVMAAVSAPCSPSGNRSGQTTGMSKIYH